MECVPTACASVELEPGVGYLKLLLDRLGSGDDGLVEADDDAEDERTVDADGGGVGEVREGGERDEKEGHPKDLHRDERG